MAGARINGPGGGMGVAPGVGVEGGPQAPVTWTAAPLKVVLEEVLKFVVGRTARPTLLRIQGVAPFLDWFGPTAV